VLDLGGVFTLFFVMLGPLKVLGPFVQLTREMDSGEAGRIAVRAFIISTIAVVAGGFVGVGLFENWNLTIADLMLAGGVIFFLVGLNVVLEAYRPPSGPPAPLPKNPMAAAMRVTFPVVVTPYGVAAVIVLLVNAHDAQRMIGVLVVLVAVMALDLLAMLFARRIMQGITLMVLQVLGAVLGVLQVALALEMIVQGIQQSGLLHG
jgi:multiple antibiotic resistance protein